MASVDPTSQRGVSLTWKALAADAGRGAILPLAPVKRDVPLIFLLSMLAGSLLYWFQSTRLEHFAVDWNIAFYPATKLLLQGQNPYQVPYFHNPVWTLVPLIPFALLGEGYGRFALYCFNLFSVAFIAYRLRPRPLAYAALLLSPLLYYFMFLCNVDVLVLWGLFLPPWAGLLLVMVKPQVGIGIAAYWVYRLWRELGLWKTIARLLPLLLLTTGSFLLFGNWLRDDSDRLLGGAYWNVSFFPWSLPIGLAILYVALRKRRVHAAIAASPFLSPYLSWGTWFFALLGLVRNSLAMVAVVFGSWLIYLTWWFVPGITTALGWVK
jgi:hypothetical protein